MKKRKSILYYYKDFLLLLFLGIFSVTAYFYFSENNLHLVYNDAMLHLNIGRRVFENIQPGLAQLGSVWLPLPHLLLLPTIWNTYLWQTGISGAVVSMASYILAAYFIYKTTFVFTKKQLPSLLATAVIALNFNFLYIQTTALTESLFIFLLSVSAYTFTKWYKTQQFQYLILTGLFAMLMTLTRYDGWFMLPFLAIAVFIITNKKSSKSRAEGNTILFLTIGSLGITLWFAYNFLIFKNPFYFAFGEFSAKSQQNYILAAGELVTKSNMWLSFKTYLFAMIDNIGILTLASGIAGWACYYIYNKSLSARLFALTFTSVVFFNILSLFLGFSVLFIPEVTPGMYFNVRYGLLVLPLIALFIGYLASKSKLTLIILSLLFVIQTFAFYSAKYSIVLIDGTIGISQKDVINSGLFLKNEYAKDPGYILTSAAANDAVIFRSGIEMDAFIHEGVNKYWGPTLENPQKHAKYIVMRTGYEQDIVANRMKRNPEFLKQYKLIDQDTFADVYKRIE